MNSIPPARVPSLYHRLLGIRSRRRAEEEEARHNIHLKQALEEEKQEGHEIAVWARTVALVVVSVMLPFINPNRDVLYYEAYLVVFVVLGWLQLRVATVGQSRTELALILLDIVLLAAVLLFPNPFVDQPWPAAVNYRFEGFDYFYVFLAAGTLAYSWRTVMSLASWIPVVWLAAMGIVMVFGRIMPELTTGIYAVFSGNERLAPIFDPNNVVVMNRVQEVVIFALVGAILGLKSFRSNQLLLRQARIASERANLSRYFPPSLVDELAHHDEPLGPVRSQEVAVLFADIVGFTRMAETQGPDAVVALLRKFHALLEDAVFANSGTLDKYLGDGVMATFGTPRRGDRDATNALDAAFAMHGAVDAWNSEREGNGESPVRLSVGVNYGNVILGDIGTHRRLEFAALGDTVNVASRLENATRKLGCRIVISRSLAQRIAAESGGPRLLEKLQDRGEIALRGRGEQVEILTF
jgi:adenylate cyclase